MYEYERRIMENLKLTTGKTYRLAVNGFDVNEEKECVRIKIVTDESMESVMMIFENGEATQEMKVMEAETVLRTLTGYSRRGDMFTLETGVVVERQIINGEPLETLGNTIEFVMHKRTLSGEVERNRADIDYLMMMGGEQI